MNRDNDAGGADVNAKNCLGQTALYQAMAAAGDVNGGGGGDGVGRRVGDVLIDAGASLEDCDEDAVHQGYTALFWAARWVAVVVEAMAMMMIVVVTVDVVSVIC